MNEETVSFSTEEIIVILEKGEFSMHSFQRALMANHYPAISDLQLLAAKSKILVFYEKSLEGFEGEILELKLKRMDELANDLIERRFLLGHIGMIVKTDCSLPFGELCEMVGTSLKKLIELKKHKPMPTAKSKTMERQTEFNKPTLDQNAQVLLAIAMKKNGAFLKNIRKGEIAEAFHLLSGYKVKNFGNHFGRGKWEEINTPHNRSQVKKLASALLRTLDEFEREPFKYPEN